MARSSIYPPSVTPGIPRLGQRPEGWMETTYGDVLEKFVRKANVQDEQKYQLVTAKRSRGGIVPRSTLYGKEIKTEAQFYIRTDDFLISKRQIIHGACGIVPESLDGSIVSGEYSVLRVKPSLLLDYLGYHCHTVYFQQTCFQSSVGVDVEKMIFDLDKWFKFKVYLPPLPEQHKIAAILSTWDEAIDLTEQLIAAKQRRKQALMQRLLTGKVRFPGFQHSAQSHNTFAGILPVDWEIKKIEELAIMVTNGFVGTASPFHTDDHNGVTYIQGFNVRENRIDLTGVTRVTREFSNSQQKSLLQSGDMLTVQSGHIGTTAVVPENFTEANCHAVIITRFQKGKVDPNYVAYYLNSSYGKARLRALEVGSSVLHINTKDLKTFPIPIPPLPEQQKIAEVMKMCDEELDLHHRKLAALRRQKQGLMQQLLTGRVRVAG